MLVFFIGFFVSILKLGATVTVDNAPKCQPLNLQDGELMCTDSVKMNVNPCTEAQDIGTIATYKCKPHFVFDNVHQATRSRSTLLDAKDQRLLKCGQNGEWIGYKKFKTHSCREDCGSRLTNAKPLIINGVSTNSSSWPWHAAIFKKVGRALHYICGGTIIQKSAILTAAHCVSYSTAVKLEPESFVVVLGATSHVFENNQHLIPQARIFGVTKIFVSESYDARKEFQGDIAILHLNGTIQYSEYVSPACLPNDFVADLNAIKPGRLGDVVGFGVDESQELSLSLKHAKLEIKSHSECYVQLERTLTESQFCAGSQRDEKWVTVCNGDSGGSVVQSSVTQEKYFIRGIVSTGDSKARVGICQNEAVFTRVFSFIGWIQNVLEEIGASLALELGSDFGIPYVLEGKEFLRAEFVPIPIEWKNQVNSIQLANVNVDPDVLLDSLEYSKTIQHINFTRVHFKKRFPNRRIRLPHLRSISMDILKEDLNVLENRRLPLGLENNYLASLIFFDQDIEDDSDDVRNRVAKIKIDVQITVDIFKLLNISQDSGIISISQSPLADDILINRLKKSEGSDNFGLKHLALSICSLNQTSLNILSQQDEIETLVFDRVDVDMAMVTGGQNITSILKKLNQLQEFVFEAPSGQNFSINAHKIPKGLIHLALTEATFDFSQQVSSRPYHPTAILFPDFNFNSNFDDRLLQSSRISKSKLKSLYCNSCLPPSIEIEGEPVESSLWNIQSIFPRIEKLVLIHASRSSENLLSVLSNFKELKFAFLKLNDELIQLSKKNGRLEQISSNDRSRVQFDFEHLDYVMNRRHNFWSSEGDYIASTRLYVAEAIGFKTGHYKFDSGIHPLQTGYFENNPEVEFHVVHPRVQERLVSMEIRNVKVKNTDVPDTTKFCSRLKRLSFVNASSFKFQDSEPPNSELPMLEEYYARGPFIEAWSVLGYHGLKLVSETAFPYLIFWKGEVQGFDAKKNFLESRVKKIRIQHGDCVGISWDAHRGRLVSAMNLTHEWFKSANKNPKVVIKTFAFKYWELDPSVVPTSIEELNLNFVILKNENIPKLLERLSGLKSMSFVNVRASDNNPADFKTWVWPDVNITHLAIHHSKTLQNMVFEKVHFKSYTASAVFDKVKSAYFESCKFDVDILKKFALIFPNLHRLVIAGGSRVDGYILLHAARVPSVQWILSTRAGIRSHVLKEKLTNLLGGKHLKSEEDSDYFIIEKIHNRNWTQVDVPDIRTKSQMEELKGTKLFGTASRCHALTFVGGIRNDTHVKLPQIMVN